MLVILLIFGLGLSGASYNQCSNTLSNNGYNLSDSQLNSFYQAANDPDNIAYINTHSDTLSEDWNNITSGDISISEWYNNFVIESSGNTSSSSAPSVDSIWAENTTSPSVSVWDSDIAADAYAQQFGQPRKIVSDGHGGYYEALINTHGDGSITYTVTHYDADGNKKELYRSYNGMPQVYDYLDFDFYVYELDDGTQKVVVKNTYRNSEDDEFKVNTYECIEEFADEKTEEIEEKKTGDVVTVPINPDGSITLPDGTVVYPNADGTYTIGGVDYSVTDAPIDPSTIDPTELLKQLLAIQEKLDEAQDDFTFEDSEAAAEELIDSSVIDEAAAAYSGNLSEFLLNSRITQIFPFCLPFDFVRGLKLLSTTPVPPKFDVDFDIPAFGAYPGTHDVITLDLSVYSKYFTVMRWVTTIFFIISLTFITYKLIKW